MDDQDNYQEGPLSLLRECQINGNKVIIDIKGIGNKKIIANIVAFDNRFNMILKDVVEEWYERRGRVTV